MNYKITLTICLFIITVFQGVSQNLAKVSLLEYSKEADYKKEHRHKLQISNKSSKTATYKIRLTNILCNKKNSKVTEFNYSLYDDNMNLLQNEIAINSNDKKVFYLKIIKPYNLNLGNWSCTQLEILEVSSINSFRKTSSLDKITIKSYIPNQNSDN